MYKTVIITIASTITIGSLVLYLFLNSILGTFGLAATSIETLNNLQESKKILEVIKTRHTTRKLNISKRFIKRSTKKVTASAVSAASIGTAAVVITVAGLEILDYCDEKKELHDEDNILFKRDDVFDYSECLNQAQDDSTEIIASVKESVPEMVSKAWESTKNISESTWEKIQEISISAWVSTKDASSNAWDITSETTQEVWSSLLEWATAESQ